MQSKGNTWWNTGFRFIRLSNKVTYAFSKVNYIESAVYNFLLQDRLLLSLTDLVCLTALLSVTPSVREAASAHARADVKG